MKRFVLKENTRNTLNETLHFEKLGFCRVSLHLQPWVTPQCTAMVPETHLFDPKPETNKHAASTVLTQWWLCSLLNLQRWPKIIEACDSTNQHAILTTLIRNTSFSFLRGLGGGLFTYWCWMFRKTCKFWESISTNMRVDWIRFWSTLVWIIKIKISRNVAVKLH